MRRNGILTRSSFRRTSSSGTVVDELIASLELAGGFPIEMEDISQRRAREACPATGPREVIGDKVKLGKAHPGGEKKRPVRNVPIQ